MKKYTLKDLTLREKIGQTICVRPNIVNASGDPLGYMEKNQCGVMWTYGNMKMDHININMEMADHNDTDFSQANEFRALVDGINKVEKIPFLPAADNNGFPGFTTFPTAETISATRDPEAAYQIMKARARELRSVGIRWLWMPVADNPSPMHSVLQTRCISSDPEYAGEMMAAFVKGIQSEGVAATVKHFPGADRDDYRDPHFADYVIRQNLDDWYKRQGVIFKAAIDAGVYSVMIGHTAFPAADDTVVNGKPLPATMSEKIITGLLKEKMGFKGCVITDAVGMRALTYMFPDREDFYAQLYNAGNDVILGPQDADVVDIVERLVLSGRIPESRIDDAVTRILAMKEKIGLWEEPDTVTNDTYRACIAHSQKVLYEAAPKGISWFARRNNLVPLNPDQKYRVQIIYIGYSKPAFENLDFVKDEFEKFGAEVQIADRLIDAAHMKKIDEESDLILYFAHLAPHSPYGVSAFVQDKALQFLNVMTQGMEKSIGVSTGSQYVWNDWMSSADNFVSIGSFTEEFLRTFVRGLYGECEFTGKPGYNPDPLAPRL